MAKWNLRSPDSFPALYAASVRQAKQAFEHSGKETLTFLEYFPTRREAEKAADRFRWWRYCLRNHPIHPLHLVEDRFELKTCVQPEGDVWSLYLLFRKPDRAGVEELQRILKELQA